MKILFFISAVKHGKGGHSHSLNVISREIAKNAEVQICGIGAGRSYILEQNPYFKKIINTNGIPDLKFLKELKSVINEFQPDVIHCFDDKVYLVTTYALTLLTKRIPIVLNKCGGPNMPDYPIAQHLVMFSEENLQYYQANKEFSGANFALIPNRAVADLEKRSTDRFKPTDGQVRIFRIGRIGKTYKRTSSLAIELIKALKARRVENIHLYLIGTIEDESVKQELENDSRDLPVTIVSDHDITVKASAFLHYADIAVCTGRGMMEASSFGLPVLGGSINYNIPIPVNETNINTFFHYNFSERADVKGAPESVVLDEIQALVESKEKRAEYSAMSLKFFDEYFNLNAAGDKYFKVYQQAIQSKPAYFLSKNGMRFLKALKYYNLSASVFNKKASMAKAE